MKLKIEDMHLRIIGTDGIETIESVLQTSLEKAASAQLRVNYPSNVGNIEQLKFTPIVLVEGEKFICSKQAVISEEINQC